MLSCPVEAGKGQGIGLRTDQGERVVIVGALVRTFEEKSKTVQEALTQMEGVSVYSFDDPCKIGLVIEAESLDAVYHLIEDKVKALSGVMVVSPVYAHFEELAQARSP